VSALTIGRLSIGKARIRSLEIDDLSVRRLRVVDPPPRSRDTPATPRAARVSPLRPLRANSG
jgi:hypothetical protein